MQFDEKVKQIESVEKDVDKVLKAARLERNPIDYDKLEMLLFHITIILGMILFVVGGLIALWIVASHR